MASFSVPSDVEVGKSIHSKGRSWSGLRFEVLEAEGKVWRKGGRTRWVSGGREVELQSELEQRGRLVAEMNEEKMEGKSSQAKSLTETSFLKVYQQP